MQKTRRGSSLRLMLTLSVLAAIGIILGKFLAFNVTEFMRFSLENTTIIFAGIVFGPLLGAVVGAVQDLVGCIAVGYAINPIITLGSAAIGLVSGYVFKVSKRRRPAISIALSIACAHVVGSVIIKSIGLTVFYSLPFGVTLLWRLLNYAIVGAVEVIVIYNLLKSKQLWSQIGKIASLPNQEDDHEKHFDETQIASNVFTKPGLERVRVLLDSIGSPESSVSAVHIAGTNGKGSVSAMLSSVLKQSGLKVGSFNSPYLYEMREAIRIDGEPISEGELVALLERLRPIADTMEDKPTEFELLTAAAYLAFAKYGVDLAVVECGMGGAKDATNVIDSPLLSIITGISIDHTAFLGNTIAEIAKEKAGIIKHGRPVLVGTTDAEAYDVISTRAAGLASPVFTPDTCEIEEISIDGSVLSCGNIQGIHLPLLGVHQPKNASIAIKAAKILSGHFPSITDESIKAGIAATVWRGRFEMLSREPLFIFDGAHNLEGIKSAVQSVRTYLGDGIVCLTGVLADKEYGAMADEISKVAGYAVTITPSNPRALSASDYARVLASRGVFATPCDSVTEGVKAALDIAKRESKPVVCLGSLYLYREVSEAMKQSKNGNFDN